MKYDNLYCKLFVDSPMLQGQFILMIADLLKVKANGSYVENKYLFITINRNEDKNMVLKNNPKDGFLFYSYYLDIEPSEGIDINTYLTHLKSLINSLRSKGFKTIAACDFEDELNDSKPYTEFMK